MAVSFYHQTAPLVNPVSVPSEMLIAGNPCWRNQRFSKQRINHFTSLQLARHATIRRLLLQVDSFACGIWVSYQESVKSTRDENLAQPTRAISDSVSLDGARWRAILSAAQDGIICIDADGTITLFNPSAETIFGYAAADVLGRNIKILMPAPYAEEHAGYIRRYRETGVAKAIGRVRDVEALRRDGTVFPIELAVSEVTYDNEPTYTAIIRDVSERRFMEKTIREERDFADKLIDTAHVIVLVLDTSGRVVRFNRHFEEISGFDLNEARDLDWFANFLPEHDQDRVRAVFRSALEGNDVLGAINAIRTKHGSSRQIQWYAKRLADEVGVTLGVVAVGHDITDRVQTQRRLLELEHTSRQKDRLADLGTITAKVVHDLGNPLAALTMQAQLIERRVRRKNIDPVEIVEKPIEQMLETLQRLEVLVREFNEFSRERKLETTSVDAETFLGSVIELWQAYAASSEIALHLDVASGVSSIDIDTETMRRVLDNLIKNALDSISGRGEIVVSAARKKSGGVRLSVADDGCGIPGDLDVFKLFETTKVNGTGIGLAIARQIVQGHGGKLSFEPNQPQGTIFHIDLPAQQPKRY